MTTNRMTIKQPTPRWLHLTVLACVTGGLWACGGGGAGGDEASLAMQGGATRGQAASAAVWQSAVDSLPLQELSAAESAGLLAMRQEEQVAHDVYASAAALWPLPVFANIASSETTHATAVATLLDRYDLPDPMDGLAEGVFATPEFQSLYDSLAARSQLSLIDALQVGCEIEELDMRDIVAHQRAVDNADILLVYDNLLRGSRNHLRSFYGALLKQGGSYTPKYLTQAEFDAIVESPMETGA